MTNMTTSSDDFTVDVQCSETVNDETLTDLSVAIESRLNAPIATHRSFRRSLEVPLEISIVGAVVYLLRLFGVPEYFKTRMQERAKTDAKDANERRRLRRRIKVAPEDSIIRKISDLRTDGVSFSVALRIPPEQFENGMSTDHFGGLQLNGTTPEVIAAEIDLFLKYTTALQTLIATEIVPNPILGGVFLKLIENGLEVAWIPQKTGRKEVRVLRLSE